MAPACYNKVMPAAGLVAGMRRLAALQDRTAPVFVKYLEHQIRRRQAAQLVEQLDDLARVDLALGQFSRGQRAAGSRCGSRAAPARSRQNIYL